MGLEDIARQRRQDIDAELLCGGDVLHRWRWAWSLALGGGEKYESMGEFGDPRARRIPTILNPELLDLKPRNPKPLNPLNPLNPPNPLNPSTPKPPQPPKPPKPLI